MTISKALVLVSLVGGIPSVQAIEHDKPHGEPYQLLGKRMVFTTWYFVRPGQPDWQNENRESVYAESEVKHGPTESRFYYYDGPRGIRLVAEPAQRTGPILAAERPWEEMGLAFDTVIYDEGKYRAWGGCQAADSTTYACYFESADGLKWQRPSLGLVEYKGSRENNLIAYPPGSIFKDPSAPPEERYKSVKHADFEMTRFAEYKKRRPWSYMAMETDPGRAHSIRASVSPDGLRWTELPDSISVEPSDTQVIACFDPRLKKYVMFTRSYMVGPRAEGAPLATARRHLFVQRRAIGRTETDNFREFPLSQVIIETGTDMPPTDTYYTSAYTTVPGAPDHHLMFPSLYHLDDDTTSVRLFTSYDGKMWHDAPGGPVLTTREYGQWDGGCVFARHNLLELTDGSWALPVTGFIYPHKYPRGRWKYAPGLAIWPKGRLMAVEAVDRGEFTTIAVLAPGTKLLINAVTKRAGSIHVEAADLEGNPIAGRSFDDAVTLIGDHYRTPVKWKSADDLGVKAGEPLILRFRMEKARIYGLDFE